MESRNAAMEKEPQKAKRKRRKCGPYKAQAEDGGMTHEQIGIVLGVSTERARQIEAAAFAKIRTKHPHLRELIDTYRSRQQ